MSEWIRLEDKKPDHMTEYLTYRPDATFDKTKIQTYKNGRGFNGVEAVTHWQPLPAPPKQKDSE